jgi:hypothetical protein
MLENGLDLLTNQVWIRIAWMRSIVMILEFVETRKLPLFDDNLWICVAESVYERRR